VQQQDESGHHRRTSATLPRKPTTFSSTSSTTGTRPPAAAAAASSQLEPPPTSANHHHHQDSGDIRSIPNNGGSRLQHTRGSNCRMHKNGGQQQPQTTTSAMHSDTSPTPTNQGTVINHANNGISSAMRIRVYYYNKTRHLLNIINHEGILCSSTLVFRGRTYPFFEDIISYPYPGPIKGYYIQSLSRQKKNMDIYPISFCSKSHQIYL
jgi:hypothetical protein